MFLVKERDSFEKPKDEMLRAAHVAEKTITNVKGKDHLG
jgi:hypothetical protein